MKVSSMKGMVWFSKKGKLSLRYARLYRILKQVGKVDYELDLSQEISMVHLVFHMSMFWMFMSYPSSIVSLEDMSVENKTYKNALIESWTRY